MKNVLLAAAILASSQYFLTAEEEPKPDFRIAVVDFVKVFEMHPKTATITADLTKARESSRNEFRDKSNALKEILQKHQELIRAGRKEEAAEELKKANEAEKTIATLRTTGLRDLEEQFRKAKLEIMESIQSMVREFNHEGGYAVVLDSSSTSSNGLPQVVHAPGATDITEEIIEFIRISVKEAEAKAKQ